MSDDLYSRVMSRNRRLLRQARRIELLRAIEAKDDADRVEYAMGRVALCDAIEIMITGSKMINLTANARRVLLIATRLKNLNRKYANHE